MDGAPVVGVDLVVVGPLEDPSSSVVEVLLVEELPVPVVSVSVVAVEVVVLAMVEVVFSRAVEEEDP